MSKRERSTSPLAILMSSEAVRTRICISFLQIEVYANAGYLSMMDPKSNFKNDALLRNGDSLWIAHRISGLSQISVGELYKLFHEDDGRSGGLVLLTGTLVWYDPTYEVRSCRQDLALATRCGEAVLLWIRNGGRTQ